MKWTLSILQALIPASLLMIQSASAASDLKSPQILLIPGAASSGGEIWVDNFNWTMTFLGNRYFGVYQDILKERGLNASICPRTEDKDKSNIETRADRCIAQILKSEKITTCPEGSPRNIILFGHSTGGLVARLIAQDPRVKNCIQSVTTISTPHQGTALADTIIDQPALSVLAASANFNRHDRGYLIQLRAMRKDFDPQLFKSQDIEDNPSVEYYSIATYTDLPEFPFMIPTKILLEESLKNLNLDKTSFGRQNDAIVPTYSMIHGQNRFLEADHASAACVDPARFTVGCKRAKAMVIPHLTSLYRKAELK